MNPMLTIEEIETRYRPDWVLIGDYEIDELTQLRRGRVLFHDPDRDTVYRKALELKPSRCAVRYLGEIPDDVVLIL